MVRNGLPQGRRGISRITSRVRIEAFLSCFEDADSWHSFCLHILLRHPQMTFCMTDCEYEMAVCISAKCINADKISA